MFSDPITLNDASAVSKSFAKKGSSLNSSLWTETARTPDQPRIIQISHEITGKTGSQVGRRMVKFSSTDKDADGVYTTSTCHVVLTHSMQSDPETAMQDLAAFLVNFLTSANVSSILDGIS